MGNERVELLRIPFNRRRIPAGGVPARRETTVNDSHSTFESAANASERKAQAFANSGWRLTAVSERSQRFRFITFGETFAGVVADQ